MSSIVWRHFIRFESPFFRRLYPNPQIQAVMDGVKIPTPTSMSICRGCPVLHSLRIMVSTHSLLMQSHETWRLRLVMDCVVHFVRMFNIAQHAIRTHLYSTSNFTFLNCTPLLKVTVAWLIYSLGRVSFMPYLVSANSFLLSAQFLMCSTVSLSH